MENFKNMLLLTVAFAVVSLLGYWAFTTLDTGREYSEKQKQQLSKEDNSAEEAEVVGSTPDITEEETENPPEIVETNLKHQVLINELQELVNDNITVKLKSRGTRVGTLQNFLNLYNGTSNKIDNDYGNSAKKLVTTFQQTVGLPANGEAGPSTFLKMIEWLKNQG